MCQSVNWILVGGQGGLKEKRWGNLRNVNKVIGTKSTFDREGTKMLEIQPYQITLDISGFPCERHIFLHMHIRYLGAKS